jgi:hypothetical protein
METVQSVAASKTNDSAYLFASSATFTTRSVCMREREREGEREGGREREREREREGEREKAS